MSDDEIIDAEIVGDEIEVFEDQRSIVDRVKASVMEQYGDVLEELRADPPGIVSIKLDFQQRSVIRESLAHFYSKGPRVRNTRLILDTMGWIADHEPLLDCPNCANTGKVRSMYGIDYCYCPKGVDRLANGS